MIEIKENELYQELELFVDGNKIGEAEISIKDKMLSRLSIFPPYQDKGYGTETVGMLTEKYNLNNLWVNADNQRAIHAYEKNGYKIAEPTMFLMVKELNNEVDQGMTAKECNELGKSLVQGIEAGLKGQI